MQPLWKQDIYITHPDNLRSGAHNEEQARPQGQRQTNYFKVHFKTSTSTTIEIIFMKIKKLQFIYI